MFLPFHNINQAHVYLQQGNRRGNKWKQVSPTKQTLTSKNAYEHARRILSQDKLLFLIFHLFW